MTEAEAPRRSRVPWIVAAIVALAVVASATVTAVALTRDNGRSPAASQTAWMQDACRQWMGSVAGGDAPPSSWCASMAERMGSYGMPGGMMSGGMGSMMWSSPDAARTQCKAWMAGDADAGKWCDAMVDWMQGRAARNGGWGPSMMRPSS